MPLRDVALPDELGPRVPSRTELLTQHFSVDASRWREGLAARSLPPPTGKLAHDGWTSIARADLFALGDGDISDESALQLLYASLAWGLGRRAPRFKQRLDGLAQDPARAAQLSATAWRATREGRSPAECYEVLLSTRGRTRVSFLGGAFATKFLYFATGSTTAPANLILDAVVATNLRPFAWPDSPTTGWWPSTYERYCDLLARWAAELSATRRDGVAADQIELALYQLPGGPAG